MCGGAVKIRIEVWFNNDRVCSEMVSPERGWMLSRALARPLIDVMDRHGRTVLSYADDLQIRVEVIEGNDNDGS